MNKKKQNTQKIVLAFTYCHPMEVGVLLSIHKRKRANFCNGSFKKSLGVLMVTTRMLPSEPVCVQDDRSWPLEWSGVFLSYEDGVSRLEIGLVVLPSLALLQTLEVICRPRVPELLKLLLIQLPSGKSVIFKVSQIN
jgi:hypothetical protein